MGSDKFQTLWFSGLLLGMSGIIIFKGARIAWQRELENPFVELRGGRAIVVGLVMAAVGLFGAVMAVLEGMKLRV